ncbi:unnamed protein product, partial [Rotaria sp. Silwood2]
MFSLFQIALVEALASMIGNGAIGRNEFPTLVNGTILGSCRGH